ncbi:GAF domain-containing protein [candidate division KSB1 bacterium]|nr:GAF domain-containing protein [candidate division KSB1 bacterium]
MHKKYSFLIEILGIFVVLLIINYIWVSDDCGFTKISPHPFWLIVLPIAIKYQLREALIAVGVASVAYMILSFVTYPELTPVQFFQFEHFKPVILFVIFGGIVGQVRASQNEKLVALEKNKKELDEKFKKLKKEYDELLAWKKELSERIARQSSTVTTLYEMAKKLNIFEINQLLQAALELVQRVIGAEKCSVFVFEKGNLVRHSQLGWQAADEQKFTTHLQSPIVRMALEHKKVVSLNIASKEELEQAQDVMLACPLLVGEERKIYGLLKIEEMPFLKFNLESIRQFEIITNWVSHSITLANEIGQTRGLSDKTDLFKKYIYENFEGVYQFGIPLSKLYS